MGIKYEDSIFFFFFFFFFFAEIRSCVKVEVAVLGFPAPNNPYSLCGRKTTLNLNVRHCAASPSTTRKPFSLSWDNRKIKQPIQQREKTKTGVRATQLRLASLPQKWRSCMQHDITRSKHMKGWKESCLLGQNVRTFWPIRFRKLQNNT